MLVSIKHKFVFLSNRKCASSSIIKSLKDHCDMVMSNHFLVRHTPYKDYERFILPYLEHRVGQEVKDYPVYALFREPTDWLFSWYRFRRREKISPDVSPGNPNYTGHISWRDFLTEVAEPTPKPFAKVGRQEDFVRTADGSAIGPQLFRYEDLPAFWQLLCTRIGQNIPLQHRNVSPPSDQSPDDGDQATIREAFAEDFRIYGAIPPL